MAHIRRQRDESLLSHRCMRFTGLLVISALLSGCSGIERLDFTSWGRAFWQRPDDVVRSLELSPGAKVADLGSGEGYFVPYLSRAVGERGRVYAVEVDAKLTQALQKRFDGAHNIEVILGTAEDSRLPDAQIDMVLIVDTYHHIENRVLYFRRLLADLAPGGRVAVIEPNAELTGILSLFVMKDHASRAADIEREMRAAGYRRLKGIDQLPVQLFELYGKT